MDGKFPTIGLVLTGGGARGAYQVGAVKALYQLAKEKGMSQPFHIISGVSAGSINAAFLASHADEMEAAIQRLAEVWGTLRTHNVIKVDPLTLGKTSIKLMFDLISGNKLASRRVFSLLETEPVHELIERESSFGKLESHLSN